ILLFPPRAHDGRDLLELGVHGAQLLLDRSSPDGARADEAERRRAKALRTRLPHYVSPRNDTAAEAGDVGGRRVGRVLRSAEQTIGSAYGHLFGTSMRRSRRP